MAYNTLKHMHNVETRERDCISSMISQPKQQLTSSEAWLQKYTTEQIKMTQSYQQTMNKIDQTSWIVLTNEYTHKHLR